MSPCPVTLIWSFCAGIESCSTFIITSVRMSLAGRRWTAPSRTRVSAYSVNCLSADVNAIHCLPIEKNTHATSSHKPNTVYGLNDRKLGKRPFHIVRNWQERMPFAQTVNNRAISGSYSGMAVVDCRSFKLVGGRMAATIGRMGVLLTPIIVKQTLALEDLRGKRLAIDGNGELYQFLALIRLRDGSPLRDSKGRITSHLSGLFYRTTRLMTDYKPELIFVFDGKPPALKFEEIARRREHQRTI